jgi:hypothetical protein
MNSRPFVLNAYILLVLNTHYAVPYYEFVHKILECNKEAGKIANMGELMAIE